MLSEWNKPAREHFSLLYVEFEKTKLIDPEHREMTARGDVGVGEMGEGDRKVETSIFNLGSVMYSMVTSQWHCTIDLDMSKRVDLKEKKWSQK